MAIPIAAIGAGLSIGKGILDKTSSGNAAKKAKSLMPPLEDPETRQYLAYLDNKRKTIESGAAYGRQAAQIGSQLANTQAGIGQVSGGNSGSAIEGMLRAQRGAGEAYGNIVQQAQPLAMAYEKQYGGVLDQIAHRKAELQLNNWKQAQADAAALNKSGDQAIMGGISSLLGGMDAGRSAGVPSTGSGISGGANAASSVGRAAGGGVINAGAGATMDAGGGAIAAGSNANVIPFRQSFNPNAIPSATAGYEEQIGGNYGDFIPDNETQPPLNDIFNLRRKQVIPMEGYGG